MYIVMGIVVLCMDLIPLKVVLGRVCEPHAVFSISYRKVDGKLGKKERVRLRTQTNSLSNRKLMNTGGQLKLKDLDTGRELNIYIDLLREFNGQKINFLA